VADDAANLDRARRNLAREAGEGALVEAAGVASNFQRMVRIADGTGITLGDQLEQASAQTREMLELDRLRE